MSARSEGPPPPKRPRLTDYSAPLPPLRHLDAVRSASEVDARLFPSDVAYMEGLGISKQCSRCGVRAWEIGGSLTGYGGISCGLHAYCAQCYFNSGAGGAPIRSFLYGDRGLESDTVRPLPLVSEDAASAKRWSKTSVPTCFGCALRSPYVRARVEPATIVLDSDSDPEGST